MSINSKSKGKGVLNAMLWKMFERGAYLGCQLIIQIVLARILLPEDFGIVSIMLVFTSIAQVFLYSGLTTAIVQRKDINDSEITTVSLINFAVAIIFTILLYTITPIIESYYGFDHFSYAFRVLLVILPLGAINAVQNALLRRELLFKRIAICRLISVLVGGIIGIIIALRGFGIWALTVQQIAMYIAEFIVLCMITRWRPQKPSSFYSVLPYVDYGWKILASNLVETVYGEVVNLLIGKKYSVADLAFYNRGKQLPYAAGSIVKESLAGVLLPAYAKNQEDYEQILNMMRRYVRLSQFVMFPIMATAAVAAKPLVIILLTEKWLECVPYWIIACAYYAVVPITTVTMEAVSAVGRSDLYLKLSIIKRGVAIILVVGSVFVFNSVTAIATVWLCTIFIYIALNQGTIFQLFNYSIVDLLKDTFPSLLSTVPLVVMEYFILQFGLSPIATVLLQCVCGFVVYIIAQKIFKFKGYSEFIDVCKNSIVKILHKSR